MASSRASRHTAFLGGLLPALALMAAPPSPTVIPAAVQAPPSVLLITVDTLRPDALGWVAGLNQTPALDRLAAEGFRFPAAVAPTPLTLPSHASILTGLVPRRHGARDNGQVLPADVVTLAELLAGRGYATAAVVSGFPLLAMFGLDRGFDSYDDRLPASASGWGERAAPEVTEAALDWLARQPRGADRRPFFLWVHYYDPHDPYDPPAELRREGPRGAYYGEVAAVDRAVAALRAGLAGAGLDRDVLTVFCADHGEALGGHGEATHGFFLYDDTILVPLVVHWPGQLRPGHSAAPARLVDVAPTVLELLALPPLVDADGVSLAPTLRGRRQELPPALVETLQPWLGYGWAPLAAVRGERWKLIDAPTVELYDLRRDPDEGDNLAIRKPRRVADLQADLTAWRATEAVAGTAAVDPATLAALRALGYTGGGGSSEAPAGLADPKDRVTAKHALDAAEHALGQGDATAALNGFRAVLADEPDNRYALLRGAAAATALGRHDQVAPLLERLVTLDPSHAEGWYQLAEARSRSRQTEAAVAAWREVVRLQPRRAVAWSNLGAMLFQSGQVEAALEAVAAAVALEPGNATLVGNLCELRLAAAGAAARVGDAAAASNHVAAALAACPELRARVAAGPLAPLAAQP